MGSFSDLFNAFELIKDQQKDIEKQREHIKKQEKEITKLKEKNREKWISTHIENYKVIKPIKLQGYSYYENMEKEINEPILFTIRVFLNSCNGTYGNYYMFSNKFSYTSCVFGNAGYHTDNKCKPIIRGHKILSDKTIDAILNSLSLLRSDSNNNQQYIINAYENRDHYTIEDVINMCKNIIKLLE